MLMTLILSATAGWMARPVEPPVTEFLIRVLGHDALPDAPGRRVASVLVTAMGAGLMLALLEIEAAPLVFVIGVALGHFHEELREAWLRRQG